MRIFDDRYELHETLGHGGMGIVYRARDLRTGRTVALKRLLAEWEEGAFERRCFEREFELLASMDLPGVPKALHQGCFDGEPYFTMEFIPGRAIPDWLDDEDPPWECKAALVARAALRLDAIHRAGIVHGDVKPSNIVVDALEEPWWIDFGISSPIDAEAFPEESDFILGTLAYLPPERIAMIPDLRRRRSDIYSLGVILYAVLLGELPFQSETETGLIEKIEFAEPPVLAGRVPEVPVAISDVVGRAMAKRPEDRFATARDFAEAVLSILEPGPVPGELVAA